MFGCCSRYLKCSDAGKCIEPDGIETAACQYNKNLQAGRIFYGPRATRNQIPRIAEKPIEIKLEKIYIDCYERNFNVGRLTKQGFTTTLADDIQTILVTFESLQVPFVRQAEENKCIMEGNPQEPANCRVNFKLSNNEQIYVIANFNSCYIKKRYADGICKALLKKGIDAKVDYVGSYYHKTDKELMKSG
jgi:hypothetical protein